MSIESNSENLVQTEYEDCNVTEPEIKIEIFDSFDHIEEKHKEKFKKEIKGGIKNGGRQEIQKNRKKTEKNSDKKLYSCTFSGCKARFNRPSRLKLHMSKHLNIDVNIFACSFDGCSKSYSRKFHLDRHIKTFHQEKKKNLDFKSFSCAECNRMYISKQTYDKHLKNHKSTFYCEICSTRFPKKHMLIAHMYQHTSIKGFSCEICSKEFITLRKKQKHLRCHQECRCELCYEIFMDRSSYNEHKKTVHVQTDFLCHYCNQVFNSRTKLTRHLKHHDTDKKYCFVCPMPECSKYYSTKYNLKHHILSTHLGETHDCTLCGAKLSTKAKLRIHMAAHNRITPIARKVTKNRLPRKDKGVPKKSIATIIAGLPTSPTLK